ncbi:MAG: leucine--tRNA ligase, partial [Candidatus Nitrosocosmicus sp.]
FNVLFPMGFHYTGTPILGMSKRVQAKDKEIINNFKNIFSIRQDIIDSFEDPLNIAKYFHNEIKQGMIEMGYSIDWRREFTTIDPIYKKFISWQFETLQKLGVIEQGSHPVGWCPNDENPVSQHDTLGDIEPSFTEYTLIKFKLENKDNNTYLPIGTLRPETIFGATNLWVNHNETYFRVLVDSNETWILSKPAIKKLELQNHDIKIISEISGSELVEAQVKNPLTNLSIPILPASFVTMDNGTGIVMSVPAHAPFDMQALIDLKTSGFSFKKINPEVIVPTSIIDIDSEKYKSTLNESYKDRVGKTENQFYVPSQIFLKKYLINNQNDSNLEKATAEIYSLEFYDGHLNDKTPYPKLSVSNAREKVKQTLYESKQSTIFYELTNKPVFCRCGALCYVKILDNQWFLNYGNSRWKELARRCLNQMDIIPNEIIVEFRNVFEWLKERACARKSGLGTLLPWDKNWIIESLSDSVIYMIYYIFAKYINTENLERFNRLIDESFFDYIIYNKKEKYFKILNEDGTINLDESISNTDFDNINLKENNIKEFLNVSSEIKKEFEYYYPLDARHSGRDLVPNHLSFFIFNHAILLPQNLWPKQIVVNGSVLMDGKKMSKSMGNIIPLRKAIRQYSADSIRVAMLVLGELLQDVDFSFSTLKGIYSKLNELYYIYDSFNKDNSKIISELLEKDIETNQFEEKNGDENLDMEDKWLQSRTQKNINNITHSFDKFKIREALNTSLYLMDKDFEWYKKRKHAKKGKLIDSKKDIITVYRFLINRIKLLSPFCPYLSEELWNMMGNKSTSIFNSSWPLVKDTDINDNINEENEQFITNVAEDIAKILKITKNHSINKIFIYMASGDKKYIYNQILKLFFDSQDKNYKFGDIMKSLLSNFSPENGIRDQSVIKKNTEFIKKTIEDILSLSPDERQRRYDIIEVFDESKPLYDAISLLSAEFNIANDNVFIFNEEDNAIVDPNNKAKYSRPFKPAIFLQ